MRDGRVNLHILQRFIALLLRFPEGRRPHVMQAVGKLDDDNPDIIRHGDEHFTDVFRLLLLS